MTHYPYLIIGGGMLHAAAHSQNGVGVVGHVARGIDAGRGGLEMLIDQDAVVHSQPGGAGQRHVGHQADAGHDAVGRQPPPIAQRHRRPIRARLDVGHGGAGQHLDALLAERVNQVGSHAGREDAVADARLREDERHVVALLAQRRGHFRADEAAANDDEARPSVGVGAQGAIVGQGAVVVDGVTAEGQPARVAARRQQQTAVAVARAIIKRHRPRRRV